MASTRRIVQRSSSVARRCGHSFSALAISLLAGCTHVGYRPAQQDDVDQFPRTPERAGLGIAPRAFETLRDILDQTSAVVEGDVSEIAFTFDDCAGPRTNVKVINARSMLGTPVASEIVLSIFGGPAPNGRWFRASGMPQFALGSRYVFFMRNTDWTFAPIVGDLAYRVETIAGRVVLVNGLGQAVTALSDFGVETHTVALTEPIGARHRGMRRDAAGADHAPRDGNEHAPTTIASIATSDSEPRLPRYGPSAREILASGRFDRPAILPAATADAVEHALAPAAFIDAVRQRSDREQVRVGGYLALQPMWRCWGVTRAQGKSGGGSQ